MLITMSLCLQQHPRLWHICYDAYTQAHTHVPTYPRNHIHTYHHTHIPTYPHTHIRTRTYANLVLLYLQYLLNCTYTHTRLQTHTFTYLKSADYFHSQCQFESCTCMFAHTCIPTYTHTCFHAYIHARIKIHVPEKR